MITNTASKESINVLTVRKASNVTTRREILGHDEAVKYCDRATNGTFVADYSPRLT